IEPVDEMKDDTKPGNPELIDYLTTIVLKTEFDLKEYQRILYNTKTYQRQSSAVEPTAGEPYHFPGPALRRMTAEQVWDSLLTLAVVKPDEYRELPAEERTDWVGVDLTSIPASKMLEADNKANEIDGGQGKRQQKYTYKGVL